MNNSGATEVTSTSTCHNEPLHLSGAWCHISRHHWGWQRAMLCGGCISRIDSLQTTPYCKFWTCFHMLRTKPGWQKTTVYMPHIAIDQRTRLAGENFVHLLVSLCSNTPKVFAMVLWKGPGSEMWVTRVGIPSKSDHILNRKIVMKPDIVMHASAWCSHCNLQNRTIVISDEVSPGPATHPSPEPPPFSFLHYSFADW